MTNVVKNRFQFCLFYPMCYSPLLKAPVVYSSFFLLTASREGYQLGYQSSPLPIYKAGNPLLPWYHTLLPESLINTLSLPLSHTLGLSELLMKTCALEIMLLTTLSIQVQKWQKYCTSAETNVHHVPSIALRSSSFQGLSLRSLDRSYHTNHTVNPFLVQSVK